MSRLPLLAAAALLLAACAPALNGSSGRIVNLKTGEEGRIAFTGGFVQRAGLPSDPDNVVVSLGQTVYSGRYTVLGSPAFGGASLGFSLGYGDGPGWGSGWGSGAFGSFGGQFPAVRNAVRPGNLIARAAGQGGSGQGSAVQTLSCTFQTDEGGHGIGSCQDSAGGSYSLQF